MTEDQIQTIDRPPRIQPEIPFDKIEIPGPPPKPKEGFQRLVQLGLPLLTIVGYVLMSTMGGAGRSPLMMIPMAISVVASTSLGIYSYIKEKRDRAEAEKAYSDRLVEMNKEMHISHDLQRRFYHYNYPDFASTVQIVHNSRSEIDKEKRTLRSNSRLWERRAGDEDFGAIRVGISTLPSTVIYELGDVDDFYDPQVREAMKLDADSRFVSNVPLLISLRQPSEDEERSSGSKEEEKPQHPATHSIGIAGERTSVYSMIRSILTHYAVFHAPMDARMYVLAAKKQEWGWTDHLPHSRGDSQNQLCCFLDEIEEDPDQIDPDEGNEFDKYLEGLRKVLAQRKLMLGESENESSSSGNPTAPFLLVVIDLLDITDEKGAPLREIEADAAISILLEQGHMLGASIIFLVPERSKVPSLCKAVIEVEQTTPATNSKIEANTKLFFRYAEEGVNSFRFVGASDFVPSTKEITDVAQAMEKLTVRQGAGANLADAVPFMSLMGFDSMEHLLSESWKYWQNSTTPKYANWMRVKVGLMAGNKPRSLVFSAKRDGVHGMVAGSTGSGKSELLISMITAMAVTYDPTVLNFVLVDYKGGGAFKEFEEMPHCVDIITNLAVGGVSRMFTAIKSEMQRRQHLHNQTDTKNIVQYRQKNFHNTHYKYPFLFIIIDEFAEMIAEQSEYKHELESITRIGRSLGVTLILAAQRPTGITDQMRSNIKFRISLRVETAGESREMLRRTDAAYLPTGIPGRGYLQVGNEEIELIQVAYTGDPYIDPSQAPQSEVIWPDRGGYRQQDQAPPPELYKAIISELNKMSLDRNVETQRAPWPGFLPSQLSLPQLLISNDPHIKALTFKEYLLGVDEITLGQDEPELTLNPALSKWTSNTPGWVENLIWKEYAMRPVVGLIDNPYAAKQLPLIVDFPRGHAVIFGGSGWGKTTFLRSLILSLAATHSPNHFHAYILDLGGRNLSILDSLPHVGAVILPDEAGYKERVQQLLREIDDIVEYRKTIISNAGLTDIYEYNTAYPNDIQPAILIAIDNFLEFVETFGESGDVSVESTMDQLISQARQSKSYGIHYILTASRLPELSSQVYSVFTERLTLKLADNTEYRAIVGGRVDEIPDIPGRGYIKVGNQPLSFQIAVPIDLSTTQAEVGGLNKEIEQLAASMKNYMAESGRTYRKPVRIDSLPKDVLVKQSMAREYQLKLDETFMAGLEAETRKKWQESIDPATTGWLNATIGVISGNRPRKMQFEAKKDGVHGLIAGGTGSGKSELLMTLILGLAFNFDPSILNFVLVDYKGGGAFVPFSRLPHTVDIVTNLNKAAVRRMFTAITAEMQRRQALNANTGTSDIVDYRKKGYHLPDKQGGLGGYPHLFIIIDEYAEMITDSPEFKDELDSITRLGRAQGVNLLLAAQRPIGVTDQMRANIKFRICLRVEGVDTSREMLRRGDAAFLPNGMPGRGYLQVGNENIELIQVGYAGEPYNYVEVPEGQEKPKFFNVVIDMAIKILGDRPKPLTPWPPFLPTGITLNQMLNATYLDKSYVPAITLGRTNRLALNPFLTDWANGKGQWQGMDWNVNAMRAIVGVLDDPRNSRIMPLIIDFTKGHAVLFGSSGWGKTTFIRSLVLSLASTHSPGEFHAYIFDLGGRNLEVLKDLPHVGTVILPDEQGYEERVQQIWREINDILDRRKRVFSEVGASTLYEYNSQQEVKEPAILVAIDNFAEYLETFGNAGRDESDMLETFVALARQGKAYGLHFLITASRLNILNTKMYSLFTERLTMRLADSGDYPSIVGSQIGDIEEIPGRGYTKVGRFPLAFQVALAPGSIDEKGQVRGEARQIRAIAELMEAHIKETNYKFKRPLNIDSLPKSASYKQMLSDEHSFTGEGSYIAELKAAMERTWAKTGSAAGAAWLQVPLGITSGHRTRTLNLEAKSDGVHGMVAGGTGSGKSELLMTLIVGLAINYSPDILNFVLVDFKGGGAFKPFENMAHCVDIVTNLNKAAVDRMFTSIDAEIRRRQALNAETNTKDIVDYREKGLHLTDKGPYPHLFIIIDEYAEMFDNNPEYLPILESITRVGRAQGVNLLLAAQRPKGVSDQMRANIKLRLCLKVEQIDTSREMLRRPDAALIPNGMPGRGYIQVGNENLELIQVAYTGEKQPDDRESPVKWPNREPRSTTQDGEEVPRLFDAVVSLSQEIYGPIPVKRPWPAFLPNTFSLQTALYDSTENEWFTLQPEVTDWLNGDIDHLWKGVDWAGGHIMKPEVLLLDDPYEATQRGYPFDFTRNHLAIFGDSGWGKTALLRSIITSLAAVYSPNELHVYVLDLGGRNFRSIGQFPHVGTVIYADEETFDERMQRLFDKLTRIVDERQQVLSEAEASSLSDYNARNPDKVLPAILVAIDNFAEIHENYDNLEENVIMPLIRRSLSVGMVFVVTGNIPQNIANKLNNLFGERITFKQANTDRYGDIVGRGAIDMGEIAGRGYIRVGKRPLMFQAPLAVGIFDREGRDPRSEAEELRLMGEQMTARLKALGGYRNRPDAIETLPTAVPLEKLLRDAPPANARQIQAVIGMNNRLQPAMLDLAKLGPHMAIAGPPMSGKTTLLYNFILSLADRYRPDQVGFIIVDTMNKLARYGGQHNLQELPHVLASVTEIEEMLDIIPKLRGEGAALASIDGQKREIFVFIDNFDDFNEEMERQRTAMQDMVTITRRYGGEGIHMVICGTLDSTGSDLRRRVMGSNFGIGLRTSQAVDVMKVLRTPVEVRGKELQVGRGYIVKAGQAAMYQSAAPYLTTNTLPIDPSEIDRGQYLDEWVQRIVAKYPNQQAMWSDEALQAADAPTERQMGRLEKIKTLVGKGINKITARVQSGNGDKDHSEDEALIQTYQQNLNTYTTEDSFAPILSEMIILEHIADGMPRSLMEGLYKNVDTESLLLEVERLFGNSN